MIVTLIAVMVVGLIDHSTSIVAVLLICQIIQACFLQSRCVARYRRPLSKDFL